MRTRVGLMLFLLVSAAVMQAQTASTQDVENVDSNQTSTTTATPAGSPAAGTSTVTTPTPSWARFVRVAATAGPIAFLVLAWTIGLFVHYYLVRREQAEFPATRGTRAPQTVPMVVSAALFLIPTFLFIAFEVRTRIEIRRGSGGVVDEWHPVTTHAWTALAICLALALIPWLFARRADTVS